MQKIQRLRARDLDAEGGMDGEIFNFRFMAKPRGNTAVQNLTTSRSEEARSARSPLIAAYLLFAIPCDKTEIMNGSRMVRIKL